MLHINNLSLVMCLLQTLFFTFAIQRRPNWDLQIVPFNRTMYYYEIHTPKFKFMSLVHRDVSQLFLVDVI